MSPPDDLESRRYDLEPQDLFKSTSAVLSELFPTPGDAHIAFCEDGFALNQINDI
jgi:hypothetical protein